jgi:hypothetical protein
MRYAAVVEVWPRDALLFIPELPGFQVNATTPAEAARVAPARLLAFLEWLSDLELVALTSDGADVEVSETLQADGDAGPLFAADQRTPDEERIELALAVGRGEVSDIVELVSDLGESGMAEARRVLTHLAEQDLWYASRLWVDVRPPAVVADPVEVLISAASDVEEAVDRRVELGPDGVWEIDGERWSLAKVLRCRTGHLREHLPELIAVDQA